MAGHRPAHPTAPSLVLPAKPDAAGTFADLGAGCCPGTRTPSGGLLFEGTGYSLAGCKAECWRTPDCGFLEYGWNDGQLRCALWSGSTTCSPLRTGAADCGAGGDTGVRAYSFVLPSGLPIVVSCQCPLRVLVVPPTPPPSRVGEGPNESAKFGEVAKNQNFGCSAD